MFLGLYWLELVTLGSLPLGLLVGAPVFFGFVVAVEYHVFLAVTAALLVLVVVLKVFPPLIGLRNILIKFTSVDVFHNLFSLCDLPVTLLHAASVHYFPGGRLPLVPIVNLQGLSHPLNHQPRLIVLITSLRLATNRVILVTSLRLTTNSIVHLALLSSRLVLGLRSVAHGVDDFGGVGLGSGLAADGTDYFGVGTDRGGCLGAYCIENSMSALYFAVFLYLAVVGLGVEA